MRGMLLFFALFFGCAAQARIGLGETYIETPGGHAICDCDSYNSDVTPVLVRFEQAKKLTRWYFYHGHIVGEGKKLFFIFDEGSEKLELFKSRKNWQDAIGNQGLKPFFTRWLDIDDSPDDTAFFLAITSIFYVPVLLVIVIAIIILTYKKKISWSKRTVSIVAGMLSAIALVIASQFWLESF